MDENERWTCEPVLFWQKYSVSLYSFEKRNGNIKTAASERMSERSRKGEGKRESGKETGG